MGEKGIGYINVCSICQNMFKSNKQVYAHITTDGNAVRVQKYGVECFEEETTIRCNKIIEPSNARASEENGCDTGLCLPPDSTVEDVTEVSYIAG